ncbi:MAG: PAQR family membrane homeostasis protein TrhA [Bifidobacterium psychraerophilum]
MRTGQPAPDGNGQEPDEEHLTPAQSIRKRARDRARRIIEKADTKAARLEEQGNPETAGLRLDVHGCPKPLLRGWIHAVTTPLALAAGIVLICLSPTTSLKWACAVFMSCSLILFGNSALYHLGNWSPKTTVILRRIDHVNIFLLIAGTYTPAAFALNQFWQRVIIIGLWSCTAVAMLVHVIWITAPRWLYTLVYIVFGVSGVGFLGLFWQSPAAGPAVVWLIVAGGICYIAGAIVYAMRWPNPWPRVFGFHEIFHCGTVAGYACHMVAIFLVVCAVR